MSATVQSSAPRRTRPPVHSGGASFARAERVANDDLKAKVRDIRVRVSALDKANIKTRYEIGKEILEVVTDATGKYGVNPREAVEDLMPLGRDGLRPMVKVAEAYTEPEIDRLVALAHPATGEGLTWSHVVALSRVPDKAQAFALAEKAAHKGWSSKDLVAEVIRTAGGPKSRGGRKSKKAGSFEACIDSIVAACTHVQHLNAQVWTGVGGLNDKFGEVVKPSIEHVNMLKRAEESVHATWLAFQALSGEISTLKNAATNKLIVKAIK